MCSDPMACRAGSEDAPLDLAAIMSAPATLERSPRRGRMPVRQTEFLVEGDASQLCHNSSVKVSAGMVCFVRISGPGASKVRLGTAKLRLAGA